MKALFLIPALLAVGGGVLVHADITHNTPGAVCVATSGTLANTTDGWSVNNSATAAAAVCPIDRDIAPTTSTKIAATVWVIDQSTTANVCCTLHSKNPGGSIVSGTQVCSSGNSSTDQGLTLAQITDTQTFSHYFISCSVPGTSAGLASKILTYRAVEE